ncbi:hypothetical protein, partial [Vibrio parahaemolyticus]|uniref:hypothetical protein n=1 Tax=Vibrio parahaemolyticus TaxID=670 RepID=UPI001C25425A
LRPLLIYITYLSLVGIIDNVSLEKIFSILKVFVIISITYAFIEIFLLDYVKQLIFTLYKREHRENLYNVATTFFGTSYYSGYVYFSIFTLFLIRLELDKNKST